MKNFKHFRTLPNFRLFSNINTESITFIEFELDLFSTPAYLL